jgi:signal peptidase II
MNDEIPRNRFVWFFSLAISGIALDLLSKEWVFADLGYTGKASNWTYGVLDNWLTFRFLTSINEGALWGIGQGYTWLFALLSIVAVGGVLIWLFKYKAAHSLWLTIALAMILAGTLGNLYDRCGLHGCVRDDGSLVYGVRDFLLFTFGTFHWPIFNFADCFLVVGAAMLGLQSLKTEAGEEKLASNESRSEQSGRDDDAVASGLTT